MPGLARGAPRGVCALPDRVGAAFGPHLPRPDTSPMIARELTEFFAGFEGPAGSPAIRSGGDTTFLSNVNAATGASCWEEIRFEDVAYSEDQAFGRAMLGRRLGEGLSRRTRPCLHAHDYPPVTFMRRYFDEYRGLRRTAGHVEPLALGDRSPARCARRSPSDRRGCARARARRARRSGARWTARSDTASLRRDGSSPRWASRADRLPAGCSARDLLGGHRARRPQAAGAPPARRRRFTTRSDLLEVARDGIVALADPVPGPRDRRVRCTSRW